VGPLGTPSKSFCKQSVSVRLVSALGIHSQPEVQFSLHHLFSSSHRPFEDNF